MKILAVGDFHGKFPKKIPKIIKKEKIDLIVSVGDYPPFHYRKLWFKHCYNKETQLWEIIGKNEYKKLILRDLSIANKVLKKLNALPTPVITVLGNIDYPNSDDIKDAKKTKNENWSWDKKDKFSKILKKYKNIKRFDYSFVKFQNYIFIGMRGHSSLGKVKSKAFRKHKKILSRLFKKFSKENQQGRVIFVSHIVPYNTKLDKISSKAHEKVRGKHNGSKLTRRIIQKYHPVLTIAGHIHERQGKDKIKSSSIINTGAVADGKMAVITLQNNKKPKVKFIN